MSIAWITMLLLSCGANATDYVLSDVLAFNPFAPAGASVCSSTGDHGGVGVVPCAGSAASDGTIVVAAGVQFDFDNVNTDFIYSNGDWTTTVGVGVSLTKIAESCQSYLVLPAEACSDKLGDWLTGSPSPLNDVTVIEANGVLTITQTREFAIAGFPAGFTFEFVTLAVPVPAAATMFLSALGLLLFARRDSA